MQICEIVPSLEQRHGGPSKSAYALAQAMSRQAQNVRLFATHPENASVTEDGGLKVEVFRRDSPRWLCPSRELRRQLRALRADIVHHHALWLRTLHYAHRAAARLRSPLIISPRGMMADWAWNHHRTRKSLVRHFVHPRAMEAAAGWHATSEEEANDIRRLGFTQPICVAPNGVDAPLESERTAALEYWRTACPAIADRRVALFYSRFHQKKRVLELIDVWLECAPPDWVLLMVGLADDYTAPQLESYVLRSSGVGRVHVFDGEGRPPPYAAASLFLLPSHTENFGMAIAEAMANGLPVLVTDSTPWATVNQNGAGWCVDWYAYRDALTGALQESDEQRRARGELATKYVLSAFSWEQSATKLLAFYRQLLGLNG